jgi:hypothetical protein
MCALDGKIDRLASERHNHRNNIEAKRGDQIKGYVIKKENTRKK